MKPQDALFAIEPDDDGTFATGTIGGAHAPGESAVHYLAVDCIGNRQRLADTIDSAFWALGDMCVTVVRVEIYPCATLVAVRIAV